MRQKYRSHNCLIVIPWEICIQITSSFSKPMQYSTKNIVTSHLSEIPRNKTIYVDGTEWEIPMVIFLLLFFIADRESIMRLKLSNGLSFHSRLNTNTI